MHSFGQLVQSFEDYFQRHLPFPAAPAGLYDPCRYLLSEGGKRVRPVLCLMANELFGAITQDAWHAALGVELFHNFTLIHDDIMDQAPLRRGRQTIHHKFGMTAGILCGDVMSIYANDAVAKVKTALPQVMQLFNKTAIEVCEGQQLDMDFEARQGVTLAEYLRMIELKTSVLLACSLKMGALTGGSLWDNADKLYDFGRNLGLAFQLQDDYLDAFGDPAKTGKQPGGDILANKKTFLYIHAVQDNPANAAAYDRLMTLTGMEKVNSVLDLFRASGADKACRAATEHYSNQAFLSLDEVAIPTARKQPLRELANYLLQREK